LKSSEPYRIPGMELIEHTLSVPLDYRQPDGRKIAVFAREVRDLKTDSAEKPLLVYLQGGPGFRAPLPLRKDGWLKRALTEYRVLMLDQRGNGLSTKINFQTLVAEGDAQAQADYLKHFRQDNIVRDAEALRAQLSPDTPWSTIAQSYGGWCTMTYLSLHPEGLKECFIFGGVPGLDRSAREIYEGTYPFVEERNRQYFQKFPMDRQRLVDLCRHLQENDVRLPNGDRLTPRRVQLLGGSLGFVGAAESLHFMIEEAFVQVGDKQVVNHSFLKDVQNRIPFDANPIFALLHEAIYAQGAATRWACDAVHKESYSHFDDYEDFAFFGEMIFPWMFDEISELAPLKEAADILAAYEDWPPLYDKKVLSRNTVPVACAVYYNDMFVNTKFSRETIDFVPNMIGWYTSEYEHCGMRADGEKILSRLIDLARGEVER
jgi:pimeloyl-ACP methyl ester carboxylesterase